MASLSSHAELFRAPARSPAAGICCTKSAPYWGWRFPAFTGSCRILCRGMIFVDTARLIVKSYRHWGKDVYTDAMIGVGMRAM
jgi:hypothetical protein